MIKVYFIVESKKWIQYSKFENYKKNIKSIKLIPIKVSYFKILWHIGFLKNKYIIFSSWRLVIDFVNHNIFKDYHFEKFMACVTSHSNINDNLLDEKKKNIQYKKSLEILSKFKVVTANSKILYNLLKKNLNNLRYCPNGVDLSIYNTKYKKIYDPHKIIIGFVAKNRDVKRIDLFRKIEKKFTGNKKIFFKPLIIDRNYNSKVLNLDQMKIYYQNIDYYLCLSNQEGTPNPALEAAASGSLLISTKVGNMPEIIRKDNSFYINQNIVNIVNLIHKISKIKPNTYMNMRKNLTNEIKKNWGWNKNSIIFENAIKALLKQ